MNRAGLCQLVAYNVKSAFRVGDHVDVASTSTNAWMTLYENTPEPLSIVQLKYSILD
jgi:hypothetical protein